VPLQPGTQPSAMNVLRERWVSKRVNTTGQAFIGISNSFLRNIRVGLALRRGTGQAEASYTSRDSRDVFPVSAWPLYSVVGYSDVGTWLASGHLLESPLAIAGE